MMVADVAMHDARRNRVERGASLAGFAPAPFVVPRPAAARRRARGLPRGLLWAALVLSLLLHLAPGWWLLVSPPREQPAEPLPPPSMDVVFEGGTESAVTQGMMAEAPPPPPAPSAAPPLPAPPDLPAAPPSPPPAAEAPPVAPPTVETPPAPPSPRVAEAPPRPAPPPPAPPLPSVQAPPPPAPRMAEAPPRPAPPPLAPPTDAPAPPAPPVAEAPPPVQAPPRVAEAPRPRAPDPVRLPELELPFMPPPSGARPTVPEPLPPIRLALPAVPRLELPPIRDLEPRPAAPAEIPEEEPADTAELPLPPPPAPPPPPERRAVAAAAPRPAPSAFPRPMDLNFGALGGAAEPRPEMPAGRMTPSLSAFSAPNEQMRIRGAALGADWRAAFRAWLQRHGYYPEQAARAGEDGTVVVRFTVRRDGQVGGVQLVTRSGSVWLDTGAQALLRGRTVPPFPPATPQDSAEIDLTINYILRRR